jgi:hypothetical protein
VAVELKLICLKNNLNPKVMEAEIKFKKLQHRKDFLSVDQKTAISAEGEIFEVGDSVKHESQGDEIAEIKSFRLNVDSMDVVAQTNLGEARICFIYKP